MNIVIICSLVVSWFAFTVTSAIFEGYYYNDRKSGKNLHGLFTWIRSSVAFGLTAGTLLISKWYFIPLFVLFLIASFPFIHDGVYYVTRHRLNKDIYPDGFLTDKSKTSTAKFEIGLFVRIWLMMGAIGLLGVWIYLN